MMSVNERLEMKIMDVPPRRGRPASRVLALAPSFVALFLLTSRAVGGVALDAAAGTPGLGGFLAVGLGESWNLRLGGFYGSFDFHITGSDIEYRATLDVQDGLALVDWYPGRTSFHLTAGGVLFGNDLTGTADLLEPAEIGALEFEPDEVGTLHAQADFPSSAFYVGFGFGRPLSQSAHWAVTADLGLMIHSAPDFSLSADGPLRDEPLFQRELENERREIQDEYVNDLTFYPVLTLGFSFRF